MRILFVGDVMGRSGRDALLGRLPEVRERLSPDVVIVNGENAAHGFGITIKICEEFFAAGISCITTGNHAWDQREIIPFFSREPRLLRPLNLPDGAPGKGAYLQTLADGRKILVISVMLRLYMDAVDDPFRAAEALVKLHPLARGVHAIFVDAHGEASSEKMALAHFLDGRVSAVVGTHTHVPTADAWVLPGGTAYQTDAGMTGDYDSVIGMRKDLPIARFVRKLPTDKLVPAEGEGTLCGVFVETDDTTGLARRITPLRLGGRLEERWP